MKTRKKLSQKRLGDVRIHLAELHSCFMEQAINTVFEDLRWAPLDPLEANADKGNFISSKREEAF